MSELLRKQQKLTKLLGELLRYCAGKGWGFTLGDGLRRDQKGHMKGSLHYEALAQDLNLFTEKGEKWIKVESSEWHELGRFWLSLDSECAWGGEWGDFNHFSIRHDGKQ